MHSMQDKRGGGLMVLWKDNYSITLTQVDVAQRDIQSSKKKNSIHDQRSDHST